MSPFIGSRHRYTRLILCACCLIFVLSPLLSSCFKSSPTPAPEENEVAAFGDTDLDKAVNKEGVVGVLAPSEERIDESEVPFEPNPTEPEVSSEELAAQAVLPGGTGFSAFGFYVPDNAARPWNIFRHDEVTDTRKLIYGGLREVSSVAISGDGSTVIATIRETTDPNSDFEVFEFNVAANTTSQLTNTTGSESDVSMSVLGASYVWEGDGATPGLRSIFLRNNLATPITTVTLSTANSLSQRQPSITHDGKFIVATRNGRPDVTRLVIYDIALNSYTSALYTNAVLKHPSLSNDSKKLAWYQPVVVGGGTSHRVYTLDLTTVGATPVLAISSGSVIDHPFMTSDGHYLTYTLQVSASLSTFYARDLRTNAQVQPVALNATVTRATFIAPYWQQPAPPPPTPSFDPNDLKITGGAGGLPIVFGKGAFILDASAFEGTNFQWSFGDGTTATGSNVSKTYATPGLYTITLTFTDIDGTPRSISNPVAANPEVYEMAKTRNLKDSNVIELDAGPVLPGLGYEWKVEGGGSASTVAGPKGSSPQLTKLGNYTYTLTITDNRPTTLREGELGAMALSVPYTTPEGFVAFWRHKPVAAIKATTSTVSEVPVGNAPLAVNFDAATSTADSTLTYTWDFGDGTTAEGATASKTYATEGRYLVTLKVKDQWNQEDTANTFVYVKNPNFRATFNMTYPAPTAAAMQEINRFLEQGELAELNKAPLSTFGVQLQSEAAIQAAVAQMQADFAPQAEVPIIPYYYPYVVHNSALLNGVIDPLSNKFFNRLGEGQTLPYLNGSEIPEVNIFSFGNPPRSTWTWSFTGCDVANNTGLCDTMLFFVNGVAFPKPLPSNRLNDLTAITALTTGAGSILGHEFNAFAGLRIPKLFIAVVPDETLPGQQTSPFVKENTTTINGKQELMAQVLIRESEAVGYIEFDLPVYAVDQNGKLAQHANGFFKARVPNLESYVVDGVMVKGKASIHLKLPVTTYIDGITPIDLSKIEVYQNDTCSSGTIFTVNEQPETVNGNSVSKTSIATLNGCSKVTTSNEAPTGVTDIQPYNYVLTQQALVGVNRVVYGRTPAERKSIAERLKDVPGQVGMVVWNALPFLSDTVDLAKQVFNTATGQQVDPFLAIIATGGLILDLGTGGIGDVTIPIKIIYKESKKTGGFFAEVITESVLKSIAEGKTVSALIQDLSTQLGDVTKLFLNGGIGAIKSADNLAKGLKNTAFCPVSLSSEITALACSPDDVKEAIRLIVEGALRGKVSPEDLTGSLSKVCCNPPDGNGYIDGAENLLNRVEEIATSPNIDPLITPKNVRGLISEGIAGNTLRGKYTELRFPNDGDYKLFDGSPVQIDLAGRDAQGKFRLIEAKSSAFIEPDQLLRLKEAAARSNARPTVFVNQEKVPQKFRDFMFCAEVDVIGFDGQVLNTTLLNPNGCP